MQRNLRLPPDLAKAVIAAAKEREFESVAAFMREALRNEVANRAGELATAEERITSKVAGILEELRAVQAQQHATLSVLDTFVKAFLTCVPEPADLAVAKDRARKRYEQFRRALGNGHDGNGA